MKKNIFILILILFFALVLTTSFSVQAQERRLEIDYPMIDGWRPETVEETTLPAYIRYIFVFAIAIGGLIVFGVLIYGGFRWLTSAGDPTTSSDAKNQVLAGFLGMIILLSSWLILTTIDPQLVILRPPQLLRVGMINIPGIHLAPYSNFPTDEEIEEGEKTVYHTTFNVADIRGITGKGDIIKSLKIISQDTVEKEREIISIPLGFYYGAVLHDKPDMEGDCKNIFMSMGENGSISTNNISPEPRSVTVFREIEEGEGEVKVCKEPEVTSTDEEKYCVPLSISREWKPLPGGYSGEVRSIKIDGKFLLVLRGNNKCGVFTKSAIKLEKTHSIGRCNPYCLFGVACLWWTWSPCPTHYRLFPIY